MPKSDVDFKAIEFSKKGDLVAFEQLGWTIIQKSEPKLSSKINDKLKKIKIVKGNTQLLITVEL